MRILFLSDIHGVPSALEAALAAADTLGYDKIALLGDLLYHGPRNGVPNFYDPVKVASMLNGLKDKIVAVRGNCDAEVDQMMVKFPLEPRISRIIVEAIMRFPDVLDKALIAASFLSANSPFVLPPNEEMEARKAHHRFQDIQGDFCTYLNILKAFKDIYLTT